LRVSFVQFATAAWDFEGAGLAGLDAAADGATVWGLLVELIWPGIYVKEIRSSECLLARVLNTGVERPEDLRHKCPLALL
jgi:hypothetical protein